MTKKIMPLLFPLLLLAACREEPEGDVLIRIENVSAFDYEDVKVSDTNKLKEFGSLKSRAKSSYRIFQKAYRYAYVELQIDKESYFIQPIDFVGEEPLKTGQYTYQIDAAADPGSPYGRLSISLKVD